MQEINFCNKKSIQITSPEFKNNIKKLIRNNGSFNLTSTYYTFLNKKNVNNLKENNFLVSLSTFGKKFVLFITNFENKKYCIFINKKNDSMIIVQLRFSEDLFIGTLFDGELVKNENNKWIYLINDIAYYKGENLITSNFKDRQEIIENILNNNYSFNDKESMFITKKKYFNYKYIKDLTENYMSKLNYKCSGLYFKNLNNFSDNYLFIFPECRSDSKILNNGCTIDNQKVIINNSSSPTNLNSKKNNFNNDENDLFDNVESINTPTDKFKLEKTTCRFLIHPTSLPDIYKLYCKNKDNYIEQYSYAGVPDIETSEFIENLFSNNYNKDEDIQIKINNNNAIFVECNYHKNFKKWVPFKKVNMMDNITLINQTQIILNSL